MTSGEPLKLYLGQSGAKPLLLDFYKLSSHGVVLAQSGAGKSTLVGRLVEEVLVKTRARVVILDANGDFRKTHLVEEGDVWADDKRGLETSFDRDEFKRRLDHQQKIYLTQMDGEERADGVEWVRPYVAWDDLSREWQMDVLGLELGRNPDEVAALYRVGKRLEGVDASAPISPATMEDELGLLMESPAMMNRLDERAVVALQMRFRRAAELKIWRQTLETPDILNFFEEDRGMRLLVLDVPSFTKPLADQILIAHLLDTLWKVARREWDRAMEKPEKDQRTPIFLVIDEAHNFVPAEDPTEPLALRNSQMIQRIAAEGRKYGLSLLLATQRPPKVRRALLAECENLCLLRLQSPKDRELATEIWGVKKDHVQRIVDFKEKGEGLLFGPWADGEFIPFRGGRRRTKETGGNLRRDWVLMQ